jgi:hypothetical protein
MNSANIVATLVFCFLVAFTSKAQNLLLNGSFEDPPIPANTIAIQTPTSWNGLNNPRIMNGNYSVPAVPGPEDGQQYVSIGNDGAMASISQTFTVVASGAYTLTWFETVGNAPGATSPYLVTLSNGSTQLVNQVFVGDGNTYVWVSRSIALQLATGTYTLTFSSLQTGVGGVSMLLDNVSIHPPSVQDLCPCGGPVSGGTWKNHGQYVSCVAKAAEAAQQNGLMTEDDKDAVVGAAADSDCGKK